jgi:hypothetical protein
MVTWNTLKIPQLSFACLVRSKKLGMVWMVSVVLLTTKNMWHLEFWMVEILDWDTDIPIAVVRQKPNDQQFKIKIIDLDMFTSKYQSIPDTNKITSSEMGSFSWSREMNI